MIELSIKISDSETKTIQFTDTKPLVQVAIAIFWEGKVYYAPVVDKDAWRDSGIRVRDPSTNTVRGIASSPFDPLLYDVYDHSGALTGIPREFDAYVSASDAQPILIKHGSAAFFGKQKLTSNDSSFTPSSQNLYVYIDFSPKNLINNTNNIMFELYYNSNVRLQVALTPAKKVLVWLNKSVLYTDTLDVEFNHRYNLKLTQTNGTWNFWLYAVITDYEHSLTSKTGTLSLSPYQYSIGGFHTTSSNTNYCGLIHEVAFGESSTNLWAHATFGK